MKTKYGTFYFRNQIKIKMVPSIIIVTKVYCINDSIEWTYDIN